MSRIGLTPWLCHTTPSVVFPPIASRCARLAFELRAIYTRERREGAFDEAGLYAALLAFVAVVFGRAADFVHVEGEQPHGSSRGSSGGHPIFAKEEFVRFTVRHQTVARLLEEVQVSEGGAAQGTHGGALLA